MPEIIQSATQAHEITTLADANLEKNNHSRLVRYYHEVPLPKAGLTLGILALGNLLISMNIGSPQIIRLTFGIVALVLFISILGKCLVHPTVVLSQDMANPIVAPVSATVFMSLMQFASYIAPMNATSNMLAVLLWYFAVSCNIILMVHIASRFVIRHFSLDQVYPTWFVGFVGIVVASATAPSVGQERLGALIFWVGFALYMATLVLVTLRVSKIALPEAATPTLAIYTAPMSLSIAGYTATTSHPNPYFVLIMLICAQLLFVFVLVQLPVLLRVPFTPSFAAFTFPFVITATSLYKSLSLFTVAGWNIPSWLHGLQIVETIAAIAIVLYVLVLFIAHAIALWNNMQKHD